VLSVCQSYTELPQPRIRHSAAHSVCEKQHSHQATERLFGDKHARRSQDSLLPTPKDEDLLYPPVKLLKDEFFPDSPLKEKRRLRNQHSQLEIVTHHKHLRVEEEYQISPTVEYQTMMRVSSRRRNYGSLKQRKLSQGQFGQHTSYNSIGDIRCYQDN
jgi:hypothetical protein